MILQFFLACQSLQLLIKVLTKLYFATFDTIASMCVCVCAYIFCWEMSNVYVMQRNVCIFMCNGWSHNPKGYACDMVNSKCLKDKEFAVAAKNLWSDYVLHQLSWHTSVKTIIKISGNGTEHKDKWIHVY